MHAQSLSHVQLFVTPRTVTSQAPLSMKFSRQKDWSRLPFPTSGDHPYPGIEPVSPSLAGRFFTTEPPGKPTCWYGRSQNLWFYYNLIPAIKFLVCLHIYKWGQNLKVLSVRKMVSFRILCGPMDCSPPGFSVLGILQARILEWVPISSFRGFSWPRDQACVSFGSCIAGGFFTIMVHFC